MEYNFELWLRRKKIKLNDDQKLLAFSILFAIEMRPALRGVRSGKTFLFKKIDEFLDTQPHLNAETIRSRKRKA